MAKEDDVIFVISPQSIAGYSIHQLLVDTVDEANGRYNILGTLLIVVHASVQKYISENTLICDRAPSKSRNPVRAALRRRAIRLTLSTPFDDVSLD